MIKGLDSFRFFAFLAVFFYHVDELPCGYIGVQAFFVLSGFLITPILVSMKSGNSGQQFFINFYGRRSLRIFPLYYFYLVSAGLLSVVLIDFSEYSNLQPLVLFRDQLPYALTYTYNFFHLSSAFQTTPWVAHFWSLAVEEQFYLIWPLMVWVCDEKRFRQLLFGVIVLSPLIRVIQYATFEAQTIAFLSDDALLGVYVSPFSHFDAFAIGGLFGLSKGKISGWVIWFLSISTLVFSMAIQWVDVGAVNWFTLGFPSFMRGQYKFIWGYTLLNIVFAMMLVAIKHQAFCEPLFSYAPFQYLGRISYGLYVYHYPIIWSSGRILGDVPLVLQYVMMMVVTIGVSHLSFYYLENRVLGLKDKLFPRYTSTH